MSRTGRAAGGVGRAPVVGVALLFGAFAIAACGAEEDSDGSTGSVPVVVATTSIWADVAANIACDGTAEVVSLLPAGVDPHSFEPSMADRAEMEGAALVVANGLGLEGGLDDTLESVERAGTPVFRAGDHLDTITAAEEPGGHDGEGEGGEGEGEDHHDHEGADPHVWQDPTRTAQVAQALGDALVQDAGLDAATVQRCVESYVAELEALDAEVAELTSSVPPERRVLVTNHDSLDYFADRYGFEVLGTVIPGPGTLAETNPADLEALARAVAEAGVPAVFAEEQHSDADAEALADRVGDVEVVTLHTDALGESGSGAETYLEMIRSNGEQVAAALGEG